MFARGEATMLNVRFGAAILALVLTTLTTTLIPAPALAASGAEIEREARKGLQDLYAKNPKARELGAKAKGILVFPGIVKAGFMFGGQYGEGALFKGGRLAGFYNTVAASYGFQAGIQKYGYALFFMTDAALKYLDKSEGFELGSAPSLVVLDEGKAGSLSTTTLQNDMYAMFFDQKGLMGGIGLQGTKISKIDK
jgi:lipid-binding SYLF domain-containing protein